MRAVAVADVVNQVENLSAAGYPEVVLTGIHIGQYGADLQPKIDLLRLLREIEKSAFPGRLRLGSIEPTELPERLLDYLAAAEWICPHYHIPLQVVVEGGGVGGRKKGLAANYLPVRFVAFDVAQGDLVPVKIEQFNSGVLLGSLTAVP